MAAILVVDEDDLLRGHMRRVLEAAGHEVYAAYNGMHALIECEERPGSMRLLVASVRLPDMRGRELYQLARSSQPGMAAVYTAGSTENAEEAVVLRKPFSAQELLERVRSEIATAAR
jgi:DNA-binding response OmpR family regulator